MQVCHNSPQAPIAEEFFTAQATNKQCRIPLVVFQVYDKALQFTAILWVNVPSVPFIYNAFLHLLLIMRLRFESKDQWELFISHIFTLLLRGGWWRTSGALCWDYRVQSGFPARQSGWCLIDCAAEQYKGSQSHNRLQRSSRVLTFFLFERLQLKHTCTGGERHLLHEHLQPRAWK